MAGISARMRPQYRVGRSEASRRPHAVSCGIRKSPCKFAPSSGGRRKMSEDKGWKAAGSVTDREALEFHSRGRPGKLEIIPTKPMATQRDLSLAYSPGVAVPVRRIAEDPNAAFD